MIENLELSTCHTNAKIIADVQSGEIWIKGVICYDQRNLFQELISWMDLYFEKPREYTTVNFFVDYVPKSIVGEINKLLVKINGLIQHNRIEIFWYYPAEDDVLYKVGEDFEYFTKAPFYLVEKEAREELNKDRNE